MILRFVLTFALNVGCEILQLDIDISFLYGNLKSVYMIQLQGFVDGSSRVRLLQKCIYDPINSIAFEIWAKEPCLLVREEVLLFLCFASILIMAKKYRPSKDFKIC